MSTTAQDIITSALVDCGILGQGETASPDDLSWGLTRINAIIDSWSVDRLTLYCVYQALFSLSANVQDSSLGPAGGGATFTTIGRPVLIQTASIVLPGTTIRFPMNMLTSKQFAAIAEKGLTGALPIDIYCDNQYPNLGFHVSPIPAASPQIEFYYWAALTQFASLTSVLAMPPGYIDALKYTLMLHLSPAYEKPIDPAILALAQSKKAAIQTINAQILAGSFGESKTLHGPNIGAAITPPILTPGGQGGEPGPVNF